MRDNNKDNDDDKHDDDKDDELLRKIQGRNVPDVMVMDAHGHRNPDGAMGTEEFAATLGAANHYSANTPHTNVYHLPEGNAVVRVGACCFPWPPASAPLCRNRHLARTCIRPCASTCQSVSLPRWKPDRVDLSLLFILLHFCPVFPAELLFFFNHETFFTLLTFWSFVCFHTPCVSSVARIDRPICQSSPSPRTAQQVFTSWPKLKQAAQQQRLKCVPWTSSSR